MPSTRVERRHQFCQCLARADRCGGGSKQPGRKPASLSEFLWLVLVQKRSEVLQQAIEGVKDSVLPLACFHSCPRVLHFLQADGHCRLPREGPYGIFAGRDASRGLATFRLDKDALRDEYDDLSDLNAVQMESVREWEMQFKEKYDYVGRLLKPGEEPSEYTDEEDTKDHTKQE
ncbi:PREDICTED: membrane-associated progesterone receptor component 2 [Merops nubicus]|uniref:membrane-associated progesterone receptor component 2 n=1 Tax=Merops nubicus TaxID=57421 RepID=UPI0004F00A2F|nr:PREDICTED: membrane-associated progesterone receptor component 2 [Merops nubicus]